MILGQTYRIEFVDGTVMVFMPLGDRDNVHDAVEIIESTSDKFSVGTLVSWDVIGNIPHKKDVELVKS